MTVASAWRSTSAFRRVARAVAANVRIVAAMGKAQLSSLHSRRHIVDGSGSATVSLTSFGRRTSFVHLAIESIGAGSVRPRRLILWLDDPTMVDQPTRALRRLQRRGLEVRLTEDLGPHKKWYPFTRLPDATAPLVTADDDTIYPSTWFSELLDGHATHPDEVIAHRARRADFDGSGAISPYAQWLPEASARPAFSTVAIGVGGVLYPEAALAAMRAAGDGFRRSAPRADDIWLHAVEVRSGIRTRMLHAIPEASFLPIRGARSGGLLDHNVSGGGNDAQIAATFDDIVLERMRRERRL
ncbi:hypothetical protein ACTHQN_13600 [Curtobacterium flaccumfaciens]